jgi:hypothetical protein
LTTLGLPELLVREGVAVIVDAVTDVLLGALEGVADLERPVDAVVDGVDAGTLSTLGLSERLVRVGVAVIVNPVTELFDRPLEGVTGLNYARDAVVDAVNAGALSALGLPELLIREGVAVIVDAVAHLDRCALKRVASLHHAVDAIEDAVCARSLTTLRLAQPLVGLAITVVVEPITHLGCGALEGVTDLLFAPDAAGDWVFTLARSTNELTEILVRDPIAVIIESVADLDHLPSEGVTGLRFAWQTALYEVCADALAALDRTLEFVRDPIAVIIETVADLWCRALIRVAELHHAIQAALDGMGTDSDTAGDLFETLVGLGVAVVVKTIADLVQRSFEGIAHGGWSADTRRYEVLADARATLGLPQALVRVRVTVVIEAIAELFRRALIGVTDLRRAVLTVLHHVVAHTGATAGLPLRFVGVSIAVVVETIAELSRRTCERVAHLCDPVDAGWSDLSAQPDTTGDLPLVFVGFAITIIVEAVARLVLGALERVAALRFAIDASEHRVVTNSEAAHQVLQTFVCLRVTVVVHTITELVDRTF